MELPVSYMGDGSVTAIQFELDYDPLAADLKTATGGNALNDHKVFSHRLESGKFRVAIYSPINALMGDGILSNLSFNIDENFTGKSGVLIENEILVNTVPESVEPTDVSDGSLAASIHYALEFLRGWNLFSLPIQPNPSEVSAVFNTGPQVHVWEWEFDSQQQPKLRKVLTLENTKGYWAYFPDKNSINPAGYTPENKTVSFHSGWNLIAVSDEMPYPSNPEIDGTIWKWSPEKSRFLAVPQTDMLRPGKGYWVYATNPLSLSE